jgi:hypothetical protein
MCDTFAQKGVKNENLTTLGKSVSDSGYKLNPDPGF